MRSHSALLEPLEVAHNEHHGVPCRDEEVLTKQGNLNVGIPPGASGRMRP